jgi:hypothetical protein
MVTRVGVLKRLFSHQPIYLTLISSHRSLMVNLSGENRYPPIVDISFVLTRFNPPRGLMMIG